jgi:hypothetical protein
MGRAACLACSAKWNLDTNSATVRYAEDSMTNMNSPVNLIYPRRYIGPNSNYIDTLSEVIKNMSEYTYMRPSGTVWH